MSHVHTFTSAANSLLAAAGGRLMELRHLRLVRTLAEKGTLTSAGEVLYLSQSALSHQLKELEEELETTLFQRIQKRMVLTQAGDRVLTCANRVLDEIQRLEEDVARLSSGESGILRLSACSHTCFHWLPSVMKAFKAAYPGVELQIDTAASHDPVVHLQKGVIDLAIMNHRFKGSGIRFLELFDDEMMAIVSRDHKWADKESVTPRNFADETLINYDFPLEEIIFYQKILRPAGVTPKALIRLPITEAIVEMVKAGMGVAALNLWSVKAHLSSPELRAVKITKGGYKRTWYAAFVDTDPLPSYIDHFIQFLAKQGGQA
jgi:LysR family transcriptional regulator, regulator for metE and metH